MANGDGSVTLASFGNEQIWGNSMKRIGLILLGCSVVCLIVGAILFPTKKTLIVDVNAIASSVVWFVLGYIFGQAGLIVFIAGLLNIRIEKVERMVTMLLPAKTERVETAPHIESTIEEPQPET